MLDSLTPAVYVKLEKTAKELERGMNAAAKKVGVADRVVINRVGSILTPFFTKGPVRTSTTRRSPTSRPSSAGSTRFSGTASSSLRRSSRRCSSRPRTRPATSRSHREGARSRAERGLRPDGRRLTIPSDALREEARSLDRADPLARFRDEFVFDGRGPSLLRRQLARAPPEADGGARRARRANGVGRAPRPGLERRAGWTRRAASATSSRASSARGPARSRCRTRRA